MRASIKIMTTQPKKYSPAWWVARLRRIPDREWCVDKRTNHTTGQHCVLGHMDNIRRTYHAGSGSSNRLTCLAFVNNGRRGMGAAIPDPSLREELSKVYFKTKFNTPKKRSLAFLRDWAKISKSPIPE